MTELVTWTDERIDSLRRLWEQGLSASAIGKSLGVSKNAVVGKAHRLKLTARPSPIRRGQRPPQRRSAHLPKPLAAQAPAPEPPPVARSQPPAVLSVGGLPPRRTATRGIRSCLWPIGDPGSPDFRFCGSEAVPGKSYCAEHCAKAYITKSRADTEAA